jgi:hypothetical protein
MIYELIGRMVVGLFRWRFIVAFIRWRYAREIRIAAGAGVAVTVLGVGAYLASRNGEEEAQA